MARIPIRKLRNEASEVVRRARAGERFIITVDGVPAAELGPITSTERTPSLEELIARGAVMGPRVRRAPRPARPRPAPVGRTSDDVLAELRAG
ncbi:MAG TPA: type II toxin-antitoxin system prevent-host-death family antitoxin [Candidatus Binatia bacterium]|nr:type II toxin-antitoxin system prevent-host-death family antitoxin [Candidatus Binatia bacterium]